MKIQSLFLKNFRNHREKEFYFSKGLNIILGENGKGKTNIIEAIFSLSFSKPFRSYKKEVFIQHKKEFSRIRGVFCEEQEKTNEALEIFWGLSPKKINIYKKNNIPLSASEYIQEKKFLSVLFSPEEMNIPVNSPEYRRKYLSRVLSPLFPEYFNASLQYNAILKQRNSLLKKYFEGGVKKSEFFFWNTSLGEQHAIIQKYRTKFFHSINTHLSKEYSDIANTTETTKVIFHPSVSPEENFQEILEHSFENDVRRGRTLYGSHRDDFNFLLRGIPLEESASRGETRTIILALKKCEQQFITQHSSSTPVLLLDDVFSELDLHHQTHLIKSLKNTQSIISTTELHCSLEGLENVKIHQL